MIETLDKQALLASVCRIEVTLPNKVKKGGIGALILPDVLVTSWHVLRGGVSIEVINSHGKYAGTVKGSPLNKRESELDVATVELDRSLTDKPVFYGDTVTYLSDLKGFLVEAYHGNARIHRAGVDPTRAMIDLQESFNRTFISECKVGPGYSGSPIFDARGRLSSVLVGAMHVENENTNPPPGTYRFIAPPPHRFGEFIRKSLDI